MANTVVSNNSTWKY